jgi:phosphoribosylanthranilate isomerase
MREPDNIREVAALCVDWMGFIFYPKSPRRIVDTLACSGKDGETDSVIRLINSLDVQGKVGVFVDAPTEEMTETAEVYQLNYLQLHGHESPDVCKTLRKSGISLIKAFSIAAKDDLKQTADYEGLTDYFLFDTKCEGFGGSGKRFDWSLLEAYRGATPFLLSGGISPDSREAVCRFQHPQFAGIDLNSGFESQPGRKDVNKLKEFI